ALSVTGDRDRAVAAVREAVPAALDAYGPDPDRGRLFGSVFAVAARDAVPAPPLDADLIRSGSGSPDELQGLARAAMLFLDPVQRGCLDLALRQDLEGQELSEALGVAPGLASVSVQAATDQAEHVIGAVLLARLGREDCAGLADVTLEAVGAGAEKLAAAVVEHGDTCAACGDRRRALVPVTTLLATVPAAPAPPDVRRRFPPRPVAARRRAPGRRLGWKAMGAGLVGLGLVAAVAVLWPRRGGEIARTAAPGGQLAVDPTPVDFGAAGLQGEVRITNSGREPLVFETRAAVPWITFAGGEGTLDPGTSAVVSAVLDRSRAPEGAADSEIRVRSNGGSAVIPVHAVVERAPELSSVEITPQSVAARRCAGSTPAQVRASIVEESGLGPVELHWKRPGQAEQVSAMSGEAAAYIGALGPFDAPGEVTWWVSAADIRNNRASSAPQVLRVGSC
ncbi:MAG TPA: hypothetical protein VHL53_05605, partial [Acidimicrobiia bacterium]|nr:hypothetical protein [Acidimicrobiia bacterium]